MPSESEPEPIWFLMTERRWRPESKDRVRDHWRELGLGQVLVLEDGLVPVRVTADGMETPDRLVALTDEQFERLLAAIESE